ncbi:MAG: tRNA 2-selenouridine(34) synthase MnmH [Chlamydiae bacterium]|nr:tRNA 2-selenouridine(34) synthase MnmH [Chlamydiota bacterium]
MTPEYLIKNQKKFTIVDVRSPIEYAKGHIPGALNIPLFSNLERDEIGLAYKKEGKNKAIEKGLSVVKLPILIEQFKALNQNKIALYCFRGGMRSSSVVWLLKLLDFKVYILNGGYKSFRNWAIAQFSKPYPLKIIGGHTGVGKTELIKLLIHQNKAAIDLEEMAKHKGSVFGGFYQIQPTQEHFENLLALNLFKFCQAKNIFIEDESRNIGSIIIPTPFYEQMQKAFILVLQDLIENRVKRCVNEYGSYSQEKLKMAVQKLENKLGSQAASQAIRLIDEKNYEECSKLLFFYYDKRYGHSLLKREQNMMQIIKVYEKSLSEIASDI